jgi:hypothetical protein
MPAAWDQLPDESTAQHVSFQLYCTLGPTRTYLKAYRKYLKDLQLSEKAPASTCGSWREMAVRFRWRHRAELWDQWRLTSYGNRVAVLFTRALEEMSAKLLRATHRHRPGDKEWKSVLETMDRVAAQLAPARKAGALNLDPITEETEESILARAKASLAAAERKQLDAVEAVA